MRGFHATAFVALLALAACGGHPLAGGFREVTADGSPGRQLEFDPKSDQLELHTRPRADGTHDHVDGSYRLDGDQVEVHWTEGGTAVTLRGAIHGDDLILSGAGGDKVEFRRGKVEH